MSVIFKKLSRHISQHLLPYATVKVLFIILFVEKKDFIILIITAQIPILSILKRIFGEKLDKTKLVGEEIYQGKNDYESAGIFYGLFLAAKIKCCLTVDEFGIVKEHKTFKDLNDSKQLLVHSQVFNLINVLKISTMLPKSWKKSFNKGVVIATKKRRCKKCKDKCCGRYNNQVNKNKDFEAILNLLKRQAHNHFGLMLPYGNL